MKHYRILSLGAGVQSTTIALRIADGKLPPIDAAIFADTQEEPKPVYDHLQWLIGETRHVFPTLVRTIGSLGNDLLNGTNSTGQKYIVIPAFSVGEDDATSHLRRQCTSEYKLNLIERTIRREILGLQKGKHIPKDVSVTQILGLSAEEGRRVLRIRANAGPFKPEFPLFDDFWTRADCLHYLAGRVPHEVPKSACTFCPYRGNAEWRWLKKNDPAGWNRAVEIDAALRKDGTVCNRNMDSEMFVHRSRVPLSEADISGTDAAPLQYGLGFERECVGMCGV